MGMAASIENPYPRKIKVDPRILQKIDVPNEPVGNAYADTLTVASKKPIGKPLNRSRVVDEYPSVIKLVKYPSQPNFYPHNNYVTPAPKKLFLHDDRVRNGAVQTIMYNEPSLAGQRKMILYDPHTVEPPKKLMLYKPTQYSNPRQRIMNYYDQSIRDMNTTTRNVGAHSQNVSYLSPANRNSNDYYYNNYPQGFVDNRFYNNFIEDQPKNNGKFVSISSKGEIIDEGGSGGTSLITVSSTPVRRNSDSDILTTRELEVETIDRFQDSTGKIYKIVKPVGERTRIVYKKPENYDRLLIVESPGEGNYVISKAEDLKAISMESQPILNEPEIVSVVEPQLVPKEPQLLEEKHIVPEEPQIMLEETTMVPDIQLDGGEEVDPVPEEALADEIRTPVPHSSKLITKIASLSTSSTQTNPKINYKKDPKTIRMMSRRPSVTEIATN